MKSRVLLIVVLLVGVLMLNAVAAAQTITGAVTNGTTGKPAAGVDVALVDPMQGMAELTKSKTDGRGNFSLSAGQAQGPRLVRVTRNGVNYFRMAPPGTNNVSVEVYDAARKVEGIEGTANMVRVQADKSSLQSIQLFAVKNNSSPPRTLTGENTLEVALPDGAQLDGADAQGPNGQPISVSPQQLNQQGHYAFSYPLKPGETRFQIAYHLPYSGEAKMAIPMLRAWNHFVVVLPPGIKWVPTHAASFQSATDQGETLQVATKVKTGQDVSFRISGTGSFPEQPEEQTQETSSAPSANTNRPGGGLGPPIDAPDALAHYRWLILGVLAVVLGGAAYISVTRSPKSVAATSAADAQPIPVPPPVRAAQTASTAASAGNSALLQAMKDELFQIEVEHQQGVISQEEYEKQKAALDQTLKRALSRSRAARS